MNEHGDPAGAVLLGLLLKKRGELGEAESLFRQAADAGNADGANNLGNLLAVRGEIVEAKTWFERGADAGNPVAAENLRDLRRQHRTRLWWHRRRK